ncbi:MAG: GNAT family N-acetyltransferase [Phototrophicaceae bacterium]
MIHYTDALDGISADMLQGGFFVGWSSQPSAETHLRLLQGSYQIWLALDDKMVVGFVSAISDGVLAAFIPNLEVRPHYQGQGIGTELMRRMLQSLQHLYSIDLMCDDDVIPFYERLGLIQARGMLRRNYDNQAGMSD